MHLTWLFLIAGVWHRASAFVGATEIHHGSFLQASRFLPGMARQVVRSSTRVLEAHQTHQRPQRRVVQQQRPQLRQQRMPEIKADRGPPRAHRYLQSRPTSGYHAAQGQQPVRAALQPQEYATSALSVRVPKASVQAAPDLLNTPETSETTRQTPPATPPFDPEAAMAELAAVASESGKAWRSDLERQKSPEAVACLTALQHLSRPELGKHVVEAPFEILLAEIFTPGGKQVQVRQVAGTLRHFVKATSRAAVFELHANGPPFNLFMPGPHHLRLGFGHLHARQENALPSEVMEAAAAGGRNVERSFQILERLMQDGYPTVGEAIESSGLLLPMYAVEVPCFGQAYAWVGNTVFSQTASITPAYQCTLQQLIEPAKESSDSVGSPGQAASTSVILERASLSIAAREFAALRILRAVCKLHTLGFSHGDITTQSIVIAEDGNVYLSDLEGAVTFGDSERCQTPPLPMTPDASSLPEGEVQRQPTGSSTRIVPTDVVPGTPEATPLRSRISDGENLDAVCQIGQEGLSQKYVAEAVNLGLLLFQVLSSGKLPSGLTKGPAPDEAQAALQEGICKSSNDAHAISAVLESVGVSEQWQNCVAALLHCEWRQTVLEVASVHFPDLLSRRPPVSGPPAVFKMNASSGVAKAAAAMT